MKFEKLGNGKINYRSGFTITEVMISIAILGILSAVGFYFFRNSVASANLRSFSDMVYSDIITSQQLAQLEGRYYIMSFNKKGYTIFKEGDSNITQRNVLPYITIEETTFHRKHPGKNKLKFFANTGTPSQGGTVIIASDTGARRCVIVSYYIGRVRVSDKCT